jgi:hypothetical protein
MQYYTWRKRWEVRKNSRKIYGIFCGGGGSCCAAGGLVEFLGI